MERLEKNVLTGIRKLRSQYGLQTSPEDNRICPQVNGLSALCLTELGHEKTAEEIMTRLYTSNAYDKNTKLFHRKTNQTNEVLQHQYNTCKIATGAIGLHVTGHHDSATHTIEALLKYDKLWKGNLLYRGIKERTGRLDQQVITHSNLWASIALYLTGRTTKAKQVFDQLQEEKQEEEFFQSHDYNDPDAPARYYTDDQALKIILHHAFGENGKAKKTVNAMLQSPSYDNGLWHNHVDDTHRGEQSTYKNALMGRALTRTGFRDEARELRARLTELYDPGHSLFKHSRADTSHEADTSLLALTFLRYDRIDGFL